MKRVYLYHNRHSIDYFSSAKKLHSFVVMKGCIVHQRFSTFKRWIEDKWIYEISDSEFCTIVKVN